MPEEVPVDDVRHALYRFNSVVEVVRLIIHYSPEKSDGEIKYWISPESIRN